MKRILTLLFILGFAAFTGASAQPAPAARPPGPFEPVAQLPITGSININYRTRQADGKKSGTTDVYTVAINVANSAVFKGTIANLPYIGGTMGIGEQIGRVTYDLDLDVVNPARPSQTRNVGKAFGYAPIDKANLYDYSSGAGIKVAVFPIGAAKGFESRFNGRALGKPPAASGFAKRAQETVRVVSGKGGAIVLTKYDKMSFENHVLPAGPVQIYPETTVTGTLYYDYGRSAWHFNNVTFVYNAEGKRAVDTLTGSIRWIEAKNRRQTGEGHYEFDIRVNEPLPTESSIFAATADESSFFTSDENIPGLTGSMNYKDTFAGEDTVTNSAIQIDLKANRLSKAQAMMLAKLILLSATVPFNAE